MERIVGAVLTSFNIPWGKNPYTGTDDPRRADYDIWLYDPCHIWVEVKYDAMSERSGNICVELKSLEHSRAHLFLYGLLFHGQLYIHAFTRDELQRLVKRQKLTPAGRFWYHPRIQVGDQADNVGMILVRDIVKRVGQPFGKALRELMRATA